MTTSAKTPTPTKDALTPEDPPSETDVNLGLDQPGTPQAALPEDTPDAQGSDAGEGGKTRGHRSAYLPVLPEGWYYEVTLHGPGGTSVDVKPVRQSDGSDPTAATPHVVLYRPANDEPRLVNALDLADAARAAASGAKLLDRLYKGEEEVRRTREEALSVLGSPDAPSTAPADR